MKYFINLSKAIFLMELRNVFAYRFVFWTNFLGSALSQLLVSYFLWESIFMARNVQSIGGYTFHQMVFYYLLAPMAFKVTAGLQMRIMFQDIYEGSLNKYLLYPLSYFHFKVISQLTHSLNYLVQMIFAVIVYCLIFGIPEGITITLANSILAIITLMVGSYLYFGIVCALEMVSFWADNVWTLTVLLRWLIYFLGGNLIPLSLFPQWSQDILNLLPFSGLISLPVNVFLGKVSISFWLSGISIMISWSIFFGFLNKVIWKRGSLKYSGVGI